RVQSVAIRIIVERELERMRFRSARYWDLAGEFRPAEGAAFPARLASLGGRRVAGGKDFDPATGELVGEAVERLDEAAARELAEKLRRTEFCVKETEEKPFTQSPAAPFTTSTLQQEGGRKLRFVARRTMRAAQRLYELGYITYMRTDSVSLSPEALRAARSEVEALYGREYLPDTPRTYKNKVKNAQEAHEAIRPSGATFLRPEALEGKVSADELRLYELIWKRTMASQMKPARGRRRNLRVAATANGREAVFQAAGRTIDFPGFLRAYVEGSDDPEAALADQEVVLPPVAAGDGVTATRLEAEGHATQPPPRHTEASLVKMLEESGIGRPSTYASIIDTIEKREYTFKKQATLVPTFTAFAVVQLMKQHLPALIDLNFTARMEDRLDGIARGEEDALPYLEEFYHGNGNVGLRRAVTELGEQIDARAVSSIPLAFTLEDQPVVVRVGRYGPFLRVGEIRVPLPDEICPDELTPARVQALLDQAAVGPHCMGKHPESGLPVYVKSGRYGPYVQLGDPGPGADNKPKMVSLLPGMTPETLTFMEALDLLALPRTLGHDPDGVDVVAHLGRYGPYVKRGSDTRSLGPEDSVLTIELERALELLRQEKTRGRAAPATLKVFPKVAALEDQDIRLLRGRYGPYVTDGEVNATVPRTVADPLALTEAEAVALILAKRAAGPGRPRRPKATAQKTGTPRKKTARKAAPARKPARKTRTRGPAPE
ncbi:MAG: type I DNA topoisomerase, partial [Planctomycetes bacterium]|nr:type I DNA topoisomerase [Planctomycetota bacterium]